MEQEKNLRTTLLVIALAIAILIISRPKGKSLLGNDDDLERKDTNANICVDALVKAINSKETDSRLKELQKEMMREYGMYAKLRGGTAYVYDKKGKVILTRDVR